MEVWRQASQATLLSCTLKETEDAFSMVHTKILVLALKCLNCLPVFSFWIGEIIALSCSELLPAWDLWSSESSAQIKGLSFISCSNIPEFWCIPSAGMGPPQRAGKHSFIAGWLAAFRTRRIVPGISNCVILIKKTIKTEPDESRFRG